MKLLRAILPFCLLLALGGVALAGVATVTKSAEIRFAGGNEVNRVTVKQTGAQFTIVDRGAEIEARRECLSRSLRKVVCTGPAVDGVLALRLGGGNDSMVLTASQDGTVRGGGGDDQLTARGATPAEFLGEAGDDVLRGGATAGFTALDGGPGNDKLLGGKKDDVLEGHAGDDVLRGGGGRSDDLLGGLGNDVLELGDGGGTALGGGGDDYITAGGRTGMLVGEGGDDSLDALHNPGRDLVNCGGGTDGVLMGTNDDFFVNADADEDVDAAGAGCENVTRV